MTAPAWMPFYVGDYLADTGHLTRDEHGGYMLLIMHYWQHGGLPDDDQKLARITQSANVDDWLSIRSAMADLFLPGWRHKRIDEEITKTRSLLEKRVRAGKIGGLASSSKRQANVKQPSTPSPSPSPIRKKNQAPDGAQEMQPTKEARVFRRGKEVLGSDAGGMITLLLKAKKYDYDLVLSKLEEASTKGDPREWIAGCIRAPEPSVPRMKVSM